MHGHRNLKKRRVSLCTCYQNQKCEVYNKITCHSDMIWNDIDSLETLFWLIGTWNQKYIYIFSSRVQKKYRKILFRGIVGRFWLCQRNTKVADDKNEYSVWNQPSRDGNSNMNSVILCLVMWSLEPVKRLGYGLNILGFETRQKRVIFSFYKKSKTGHGVNQSRQPWFSPGGKATGV